MTLITKSLYIFFKFFTFLNMSPGYSSIFYFKKCCSKIKMLKGIRRVHKLNRRIHTTPTKQHSAFYWNSSTIFEKRPFHFYMGVHAITPPHSITTGSTLIWFCRVHCNRSNLVKVYRSEPGRGQDPSPLFGELVFIVESSIDRFTFVHKAEWVIYSYNKPALPKQLA